MKLTKLLCLAVGGAMVLSAFKASAAFPLTLKNLSGKLMTTANYGTNAETTADKYTTKSFNTKKVMQLISNTIAMKTEGSVPKDLDLVYDPYTFDLYVTNNLGYYYSLSHNNLGYCYIDSIATKFKGGANSGGSENDKVISELDLYNLQDMDGKYYEVEIYGAGNLNANLNKKGVAKMQLSVKGSGYGEYQSSDHGVATGSFALKGSGTVPMDGLPYSVWWWNND